MIKQRNPKQFGASNSLPPFIQNNNSLEVDEDLTLVRKAIAGEAEAQRRLYAAHTPRLHRIAFGVLRNREDAEDAVQDAWRRAYLKLHTFEGRSSFSTWVTRIVLNSALMIRRGGRQLTRVSLGEEEKAFSDDLLDGRPSPEETYGRRELRELLAQQIRRLPASVRIAYVLHEISGLDTPQTSKVLRMTHNAFKSRLYRARRRLIQSLSPQLVGARHEAFRSKTVVRIGRSVERLLPDSGLSQK